MVSKEEIRRAAQEVKDADGRYCHVKFDWSDKEKLEVEWNADSSCRLGDLVVCEVLGEETLSMSVDEIAGVISKCLD